MCAGLVRHRRKNGPWPEGWRRVGSAPNVGRVSVPDAYDGRRPPGLRHRLNRPRAIGHPQNQGRPDPAGSSRLALKEESRVRELVGQDSERRRAIDNYRVTGRCARADHSRACIRGRRADLNRSGASRNEHCRQKKTHGVSLRGPPRTDQHVPRTGSARGDGFHFRSGLSDLHGATKEVSP